jgi:nucleoside diphosphate kinase
MNGAFVFIKPHANTEKAQALVKDTFAAKGITIIKEGELKGEVIDEKKLIDQHYYAIANKAVILSPDKLPVPEEKFKEAFGMEWKEALEKKLVYNAMEASKKLNKDGAALEQEWRKAKKTVCKFGGGFYCGKLPLPCEDGEEGGEIFVFNAFYMSMRDAFVKPGTSIHFYHVEFDPTKLSWADFRGKVLGPTNPADAPADSLRGKILKDWEALGLSAEPDTGNNGVHASASPFEGLAERMNWLGTPISDDPMGKLLLSDAGLTEELIKAWSLDPQVEGVGSIFDALEDMDVSACVEKCATIASSLKA